MIFGGQAVLLYGDVRLTEDIDVTLALSPYDAEPFLAVLVNAGFKVLVDDPSAFLRETFVLPVLDPDSDIRIDLVFTSSEYERQAIDRATIVLIDGAPVAYISKEDLVVVKTIAGRARDLDDIKSVLDRQVVDQEYIRGWLRQFDAELGENYEARFLALTGGPG
jgi:hypothetical protein